MVAAFRRRLATQHEGHQPTLVVRFVRHLGKLVGVQDLRADGLRIGERLQAGRMGCELVVAVLVAAPAATTRKSNGVSDDFTVGQPGRDLVARPSIHLRQFRPLHWPGRRPTVRNGAATSLGDKDPRLAAAGVVVLPLVVRRPPWRGAGPSRPQPPAEPLPRCSPPAGGRRSLPGWNRRSCGLIAGP